MKKILIIISFLILLATFISCSNVDMEIQENGDFIGETGGNDQDESSNTYNSVTYTMYADFTLGSNSTDVTDKSEISLKSAGEKEFSFKGRTIVDRPENTLDNINLKIYNETYELTYVNSKKLFSATKASKFKDKKAIVNCYKSDTRLVEILSGDTTPVFFYTNVADRKKEGDFTEYEALAAAKTVILELYGENALEGYSLIQYVDDSEKIQEYSIGFKKRIFGYETNDIVIVKFDMEGNFIGLNAYQYGILAGAENDLAEEEIKNAIAYVEQNLSSDWRIIGIPEVVIDVEGDYYIRVGILRNNGELAEAMQVYVNIR